MANLFVRSTDGSDADNGTTWALAKATLAGALAVAAAGDTIYVSDNHAESQASAMTLTSPGTAANPCRILCVDDTGDPANPTTLATTATVTTTGNSNISFAGFAYIYGITFSCGDGATNPVLGFNSSAPFWFKLEACVLKLNSSAGATNSITFGYDGGGADDQLIELVNTKLSFNSTGQRVIIGGKVKWSDTASAITGAAVPTTLFIPTTGVSVPMVELFGIDLSALGSGKTLVDVSVVRYLRFQFVDCKLGSSVAITTGSIAGPGGMGVTLVNCDSADTQYRYAKIDYQGTIVHETTVLRTGGASDGTTPISRLMNSSANTKFFNPLYTDWCLIWNDNESVGMEVTMHALYFGAVILTDAEVWIEVESLESSGFPLGSFTSDRAANILATPADQGDDGNATWTGYAARQNSHAYSLGNRMSVQGLLWQCTTAGTSDSTEPVGYTDPVPRDGDIVTDGTAAFQAAFRIGLLTNILPEERGWIRARVALAKASTELFLDPDLNAVPG